MAAKCDAVVVESDERVVREACPRAAGLRYRRWQIATPLGPWSRRTRVWFFKETQAALRLAHESWGVVALAGTGARVGGYTPAGRWCQLMVWDRCLGMPAVLIKLGARRCVRWRVPFNIRGMRRR